MAARPRRLLAQADLWQQQRPCVILLVPLAMIAGAAWY
jgi:hypothetical protein